MAATLCIAPPAKVVFVPPVALLRRSVDSDPLPLAIALALEEVPVLGAHGFALLCR